MHASSSLFLAALGVMAGVSLARGQTNVTIPSLKIGDKTVSNAIVRSVSPSHIVVTFDGGGARVPMTNLPPAWQGRFGYDPAKASNAMAIEKLKRETARAQYDARSRQAATQRAYGVAFQAAKDEFGRQTGAIIAELQSAEAGLADMKNRQANLQVERQRAWERYLTVNIDYPSWYGEVPDTTQTRLAYARSLDEALIEVERQIPIAEKSLQAMQEQYPGMIANLQAEFQSRVEQIQQTYGFGTGTNSASLLPTGRGP